MKTTKCDCGHTADQHGYVQHSFGGDTITSASACLVEGCYCSEWRRTEKCNHCGHIKIVKNPKDASTNES
jgi:hypothetical protein